MVAPTPPAADSPSTITEQGIESFVRTYYDAVGARNYETSWAQLTPEFQRGMSRSYEYYVSFWNDNDVEVVDVELVRSDEEGATVNVELRWNDDAAAVIDQFTLRFSDNGQPLIASQRTLD